MQIIQSVLKSDLLLLFFLKTQDKLNSTETSLLKLLNSKLK